MVLQLLPQGVQHGAGRALSPNAMVQARPRAVSGRASGTKRRASEAWRVRAGAG